MNNLKWKFINSILIILMTNATYAQDWPELERFKDQNALLESPSSDEQRVVFIGNSITEGWLQDSLSFFNTKAFINRGIGGQTTPQMLLRFRTDVIDLEPSAVVILAGINDIAGNTGPATQDMITNNIMSMVELAKANEIKVVLCSVLPAFDFPWNPGINPSAKVVALNAWIKEYSKKNRLIYIDYFSAMADKQNGLKKDLTYDGVHPNVAGYKVMEPLAKKAIKKALKIK